MAKNNLNTTEGRSTRSTTRASKTDQPVALTANNPLYNFIDRVTGSTNNDGMSFLNEPTKVPEALRRNPMKYSCQQQLTNFLATKVNQLTKVVLNNSMQNEYIPDDHEMYLDLRTTNAVTATGHEFTHAFEHELPNSNIYQDAFLKYLVSLEILVGKPLEDEHIQNLFDDASKIVSANEFHKNYPYKAPDGNGKHKNIVRENSFSAGIIQSFKELDIYLKAFKKLSTQNIGNYKVEDKIEDEDLLNRISTNHNIQELKQLETKHTTNEKGMSFTKAYNIIQALRLKLISPNDKDEEKMKLYEARNNWQINHKLQFFNFSEFPAHIVEYLHDDWRYNGNKGAKDFLHYIVSELQQKFIEQGLNREEYQDIHNAFDEKLALLKEETLGKEKLIRKGSDLIQAEPLPPKKVTQESDKVKITNLAISQPTGVQEETKQPASKSDIGHTSMVRNNDWYDGEKIREKMQVLTNNSMNFLGLEGKITKTHSQSSDINTLEDFTKAVNDAIVSNENNIIIPIKVNAATKVLTKNDLEVEGEKIETSHWVGLKVDAGKNPKEVTYIDPMGHPMSKQVYDILLNAGFKGENIKQPYKSSSNIIIQEDDLTNRSPGLQQAQFKKKSTFNESDVWLPPEGQNNQNDCGPFLTGLMARLVVEGKVQLPEKSLTLKESIEGGQAFRKVLNETNPELKSLDFKMNAAADHNRKDFLDPEPDGMAVLASEPKNKAHQLEEDRLIHSDIENIEEFSDTRVHENPLFVGKFIKDELYNNEGIHSGRVTATPTSESMGQENLLSHLPDAKKSYKAYSAEEDIMVEKNVTRKTALNKIEVEGEDERRQNKFTTSADYHSSNSTDESIKPEGTKRIYFGQGDYKTKENITDITDSKVHYRKGKIQQSSITKNSNSSYDLNPESKLSVLRATQSKPKFPQLRGRVGGVRHY